MIEYSVIDVKTGFLMPFDMNFTAINFGKIIKNLKG